MSQRPRVVIVGAGFGGLAAARKLEKQPVEVTLIDRNNYHTFQPLLYQVATAGLNPADVGYPIRGVFRKRRSVKVKMGEVSHWARRPGQNASVCSSRRVRYTIWWSPQ